MTKKQDEPQTLRQLIAEQKADLKLSPKGRSRRRRPDDLEEEVEEDKENEDEND